MRVHSLFGLLAGAALLGAVPGEAAADLRTNASGRWQYVSALGAEYGRLMGQPALMLQSGSTLATLAGGPTIVTSSNGEDEDDDENGSWFSSAYVVVLAGVGGGAYLASELIGGGSGGSSNTPPTSGGPNTPPTSPPLDPTGGTGGPSASPAPATPPETTAPEPVTMTLLATGLAGMGGAQIRRRRKSSDIA